MVIKEVESRYHEVHDPKCSHNYRRWSVAVDKQLGNVSEKRDN